MPPRSSSCCTAASSTWHYDARFDPSSNVSVTPLAALIRPVRRLSTTGKHPSVSRLSGRKLAGSPRPRRTSATPDDAVSGGRGHAAVRTSRSRWSIGLFSSIGSVSDCSVDHQFAVGVPGRTLLHLRAAVGAAFLAASDVVWRPPTGSTDFAGVVLIRRRTGHAVERTGSARSTPATWSVDHLSTWRSSWACSSDSRSANMANSSATGRSGTTSTWSMFR